MEENDSKSGSYSKRPLWQWVVFYLVIGGIIYGLIYYFVLANKGGYSNKAMPQQQNSQVNPTDKPTMGSEQSKTTTTVEYTSQGFNPKSITVKSGATVTWVNKGSDPMWVASAPHPVHTNLSGFDALKGASTGGSYSYTFTKIGTWKYHNHLSPSKTGEVVVE